MNLHKNSNKMQCIIEESYFTKFIKHLIQSVRSDDLSAYLKQKKKTVLCNFCYKSVAAVREFQRVMNYEELMNATQDEPIHYAKICLSFARADFMIFQNELELNLKIVFSANYFSKFLQLMIMK